MDLRITERALKDLDLSADLLGRNVEELVDEHPVIKAFAERRAQTPIGQEAIQLPKSRQVVYSLHSGRFRGLTWFDDDDDVCWLLGAGFHESGSRDDAYTVLKRRDGDGDLLPTENDYLALYRWRESLGVSNVRDLVAVLAELGPSLLADARAKPGRRLKTVIEEAIEVEVLVEELFDGASTLRQYTVTFLMPPRRPGVLPSGTSWQTMLAFACLPKGAKLGNLEWRTDAQGETVVYIEVD